MFILPDSVLVYHDKICGIIFIEKNTLLIIVLFTTKRSFLCIKYIRRSYDKIL